MADAIGFAEGKKGGTDRCTNERRTDVPIAEIG
jgi:hypothetical protein